ncbi:MAG: ABC transporter permease, partial [Bacteroidia bacterium]|nr:ABC transporter permease [Bacteroidia bacterium]
MHDASPSFQKLAWKRLKKNKGAIFGLVLIALAVFVAVFAYYIAPDPSPFANRIILEIGGEKPGFEQSFIKVKKDKKINTPVFFKRLLQGKEDAWFYIPIVGNEKKDDSIIVQKYIDEGVSERQAFHTSQVDLNPITTQKFYLGTDKYGRDILSR